MISECMLTIELDFKTKRKREIFEKRVRNFRVVSVKQNFSFFIRNKNSLNNHY